MKMEWPKSKELTESDLLEKTFGLKDAPYWPLWFCKNWMSGKNVVTNLYAKKLLTNQIAGFLNIYWQAGGYAPFNLKEVLLKGIGMQLSVLCTVSYFAPRNAWKYQWWKKCIMVKKFLEVKVIKICNY